MLHQSLHMCVHTFFFLFIRLHFIGSIPSSWHYQSSTTAYWISPILRSRGMQVHNVYAYRMICFQNPDMCTDSIHPSFLLVSTYSITYKTMPSNFESNRRDRINMAFKLVDTGLVQTLMSLRLQTFTKQWPLPRSCVINTITYNLHDQNFRGNSSHFSYRAFDHERQL